MLIVGGALREDNAAVHQALIEALLPEGPLVIIPAASGRPARSASGFAESLQAYGLPEDRIFVFPLALWDDSGTEDVDESLWARNAWDEELVTQVSGAAGFWFTGGDQMRIVRAQAGGAEQVAQTPETGFGELLQRSIAAVNETQQTASTLKTAFEQGKEGLDLAEVMIAAQKSSVSFEAMVAVRNKLVEAYKDVMSMPV